MTTVDRRTADRRGRVPLRRRRGGTTAVEFAVMAIPFFLTIFASIELGRGLMTRHSLEEAARAGCRAAVVDGASTADVVAAVDEVMQPFGVTNYTVTTTADFGNLQAYKPVTVRVEADYVDCSWLPAPQFLAGKTLSGSCTLARETQS